MLAISTSIVMNQRAIQALSKGLFVLIVRFHIFLTHNGAVIFDDKKEFTLEIKIIAIKYTKINTTF